MYSVDRENSLHGRRKARAVRTGSARAPQNEKRAATHTAHRQATPGGHGGEVAAKAVVQARCRCARVSGFAMEVDAQECIGLTESFSSWQFDGRSVRGSTSSCSSKGSSGWTSDALGMPDFRCTSWAQSVESLARSVRSSCSSSDSLSSASSGGRCGSSVASGGTKKVKQPKKSPKKALQKKALGGGGWRPTVGDVLEAGSVIPEGVPPARAEPRPHLGTTSPSVCSAPVPSTLRLEGYLKKKNPHGITWYKRRWAVLDPQACTLSFFKERWQSQLGTGLPSRTIDVRGYQLCDAQLGRRWSFSLTTVEDLPDPSGKRGAFELVAESQHDFELWTSALREACGNAPIIETTTGTLMCPTVHDV